MDNKIILEILELCEDEIFMNKTNPVDTTIDSFDQGLLAGRVELARDILDIVKQESNALHGVKNVMYNRHQLKIVMPSPSENPDRIDEPKMWKHYCEEEETEMEVGEGEACNWCEKEEDENGGNC